LCIQKTLSDDFVFILQTASPMLVDCFKVERRLKRLP